MIDLQKIVFMLIMVFMISSFPQVLAQISIGSPAEQISVEITINSDGDAHVEHLVKKSNTVIQVNTIPGTRQNLSVKDVNGGDVQHAIIGDNIGVSIFPTNENIVIKYELEDVLFLNDGVWMWDFFYPVSSSFFFPEEVDLVFANERPIYIKDLGGIMCHGCDMNLEYIINEPTILYEIEWEEEKFPVFIRTLDDITQFYFDQSTKRIIFETSKGNRLVTLIIPLELLWNPYQVYLNEEKILTHEFSQNSTHVWLNIRPEAPGILDIIGMSVVPEFSIMVPLVVGLSIVLGFQLKNKINLR